MQRITLQTGATLIEVITASAVGVLLLSVAVPVGHRVRLAGTTEQDAAQQQTIHAAMVRDSKGNPGERLPTPGLINRLPYNGQQVPGEGGEDYAQNKTQNLYSACIARGLFGPQILVGATEVNPVVEAYTAYNYNAYRPDADSYWDPIMQAQIGGTAGSSKSHTSFAHQLLCGLRKDVYWRGTADANRPLVCTRGTQNGVTTGDRYVRSPTLRLHGAPDSWEGNVCYGDNHVELATSFTPPRSNCACGTYNAGAVTPDNLFRCAGTTDATEFTGSGCVELGPTGAPNSWAGMDAMLGIHPNSATRYIVIPAWDSLITP